MYVTAHGHERISERTGVPKRSTDRVAERALARGLTHSDTSGRLHRYLDALYLSHRTANNMRVWDGRVYLFNQEKLITVINLPPKMRKPAESMLRAKKRGEQDGAAPGLPETGQGHTGDQEEA